MQHKNNNISKEESFDQHIVENTKTLPNYFNNNFFIFEEAHLIENKPIINDNITKYFSKQDLENVIFITELINEPNEQKFILLTKENVFVYKFYEDKPKLEKKIKNIMINFISISNDTSCFSLHINSKLQQKNKVHNFQALNKNEAINFSIELCKICFQTFSIIKSIVIYPKDFANKINSCFDLNTLTDTFNEYAKDYFKNMMNIIPIDSDEVLLKIVPLNKQEDKFTIKVTPITLVITNKRIIETKINKEISIHKVRSISKLEQIILYSKECKIEMEFDNFDFNLFYQSLLYKMFCEVIKSTHSNECLNLIKIKKIN